MLAEQVGGHTPTLEGFHWRHDALPHQTGGMTIGAVLWAVVLFFHYFVFSVNLLCTGKERGVGDTRSPRNLDWCLRRSSTALASFHWHFMTNQNVSVRPPHASSGTEDGMDVSLNELFAVDCRSFFCFFLFIFPSLAHLYWPGPQRKEVFLLFKKWN